MAERTLNTRIKLRYASYTDWQNSSVQLLPGELAVCYIEANNQEIKNTAPTVLFKVGDGEHVFKDLKWSSARAADVYDWAKAESRPEYTKGDVGLGNVRNVEGYAKTETYSKEEVNAKIEEIQGALEADTNTTYRFDLSKANEITIYSKNIGEEEVKVGTFAVDFEAIVSEINGVKNRVKSLEDNKADKTQLADYYTKEEADGKFLTSHQDISGKADKTYVDGELAKKVNVEDYNEVIGGINGQISTANGKISSLEGRMDVVEGKFDDYATSEYVNGQLALKANKAEVEQSILDINNKFNDYYTKEAADAAFMSESEVDARINKIITDAVEGDTLTSLTELVQYINTHGGEAAEMAAAIEVLEGKLVGIDGTVAKYVSDAIDALKIGDYAKASDLLALTERVGNIEAKPAMGITSGDIANWNSAEQDAIEAAKSYTDGQISTVSGTISGVDNRLKAVEGDYLKGQDKEDLLEAINTEKGRVDTLVNTTVPGLDNRVKALEAKPFDTYATKSEVQAVDQKADGIDNRLKVVEGDYLKSQDKADLNEAIAGEKTRAEGEELKLSNRIKNVEDNYLSSLDTIIWDCGGAN
jgi:hypothetical protein